MKRHQRDTTTKTYPMAKSAKIVQNTKVKNISELPSKILLKIFGYLPVCDILHLDRVSKKFQLFSRQPEMITRVNFSPSGTNVPLLFVPGNKFKKIHGFLNFLESERSRNITSLNVNYDIFDKGINEFYLTIKHLKMSREDFHQDDREYSLSRGRKELFTDLMFHSWPCKNLKEFGFVLSAHRHKWQPKREVPCRVMGDVNHLIQNLRENCPNLETLIVTAYPAQKHFKDAFLDKWDDPVDEVNKDYGLLDAIHKWLPSDPFIRDVYGRNFHFGEKKPRKIPRLKRLLLRFALPANGKKDINSYLGPKIRQKIDSMENVEIEVIPNQGEDKHECMHGFCWGIEDPDWR